MTHITFLILIIHRDNGIRSYVEKYSEIRTISLRKHVAYFRFGEDAFLIRDVIQATTSLVNTEFEYQQVSEIKQRIYTLDKNGKSWFHVL